jgi:hypothetical protein
MRLFDQEPATTGTCPKERTPEQAHGVGAIALGSTADRIDGRSERMPANGLGLASWLASLWKGFFSALRRTRMRVLAWLRNGDCSSPASPVHWHDRLARKTAAGASGDDRAPCNS